MPPDADRGILELEYRNPRHPSLALECFSLRELQRRVQPGFFERAQRPHFHVLALYVGGWALQEVDFVEVSCVPGTVIHVHPGQVRRFRAIDQAEALIILYTPEFHWPVDLAEPGAGLVDHLTLSGAELVDVRAGFEAVAREYAATDGGAVSAAILRHELAALLLRVEREARRRSPAPGSTPGQRETFERFRRELETRFGQTRKVQDYADALGCVPRTLNRATSAIAGVSAKRYVDARVALEAKRLLTHTSLGTAEIAARLSFSEPTNFVKFFRRETGLLPGDFRHARSGC